MTRWDKRFFASTRGQVVNLLRRGPRTVDELAGSLELTDNAVRAHLAVLERDGLVTQIGVRRGAGKPAHTYALLAEAEQLFPKADATLLRILLDVLADELPESRLDGVMQAVGRRIASANPAGGGDPAERVDSAIALLNDLGGLAERIELDDAIAIRGFSCPIAAVAPGHPGACRLAAAVLTEVIGSPVCERCEQGNPPRCQFIIASTGANHAQPAP